MSMYLEYYGLKCEPFTIAPDPAFLYPSNFHRQALAHLKYGLDREGGFILLTGEVGTGKTTLTRMLLEQVPANVRVAYILNAKLGAEDVLASICHELGVVLPSAVAGSPVKLAIDALNRDLLVSHTRGRKTLVVIEEAQNLSADVLEVLRLLTNLETNTHKLLHILLVGQPELLDLIGQQQLRQLNQRVVSRYHLPPLDRNDLANYINHRLHRAGARNPLFDAGSIAAVYRLSGGIPRLVNLIAQHALIAGYSLGQSRITAPILKKAAAEILGTNVDTGNRKKAGLPGTGMAVAASVLVLGVILFLTGSGYVRLGDLLETSVANGDKTAVAALVAPASAAGSGQETIVSAPHAETRTADTPGAGPITAADNADASGLQVQVASLGGHIVSQQDRVETDGSDPVQTDAANPYNALLQRWNIDAENLRNEAAFCAVAEGRGLRCARDSSGEVAELLAINRVGVVWLVDGAANQRAYLLTAAGNNTLTLSAGADNLILSSDEFLQRWSGSYLYLWSPPPDFSRGIGTGAINARVVGWLQDRLQQVDPDSERLVTGGRYSVAVRDQVTRFQRNNNLLADGILGPRTILKLNQRAGLRVPVLVAEEGG